MPIFSGRVVRRGENPVGIGRDGEPGGHLNSLVVNSRNNSPSDAFCRATLGMSDSPISENIGCIRSWSFGSGRICHIVGPLLRTFGKPLRVSCASRITLDPMASAPAPRSLIRLGASDRNNLPIHVPVSLDLQARLAVHLASGGQPGTVRVSGPCHHRFLK